MDIIGWMKGHARLFRHAGEALLCCEKKSSIVLLGPFGCALGQFYRNLCPTATIKCYSTDDDDLGIAGMMGADGAERLESYSFFERNVDLVAAPLLLQSLDTVEATPFLFSSYDALCTGGVFYLSFPDAFAPTVEKKGLYDAWYDENRKVYMKYYMVDDVLRSLETMGFEILAIEKDEMEDFERVVSVIARRK